MTNETARELQMHIDNSAQLVKQVAEPTYRNLEKKMAKGTYGEKLAHQAMVNLATAGARDYVAQYCTAGEKWHEMFSVADRRDCAAMLLKSFADEVACGNGWLAR